MEDINGKEEMFPQAWRDKALWAAIAVAPFFWWILLWWNSPASLNLAGPLYTPVTFLLIALVYPVAEEFIFRGVLQGALLRQSWGSRRLGPITMANLIVSLAFSGLHFFYHVPLWAALVLLPSLIYGYFRDKYQRVLPAAMLHVYYNTGYFLLFLP